MSVITPILDTLLHDVLGRRTAAPALRSLNETVTPVRPAALLQPGQQDGMPDVRGAGLPTVADPGRPGTRLAPGALVQHGGAMPEGVQARLSPVALVIADALGRFPAPPSTLRILTPLIPERVSLTPPLLAAQLQSSINDSGLFYEAHLARWYRGALPLTQLLREPQMQVPDSPSVARGVAELSEPLQGIVRHQLELLAVPVLRWEGEVWAGIFMQLLIQLPDPPAHADGDAEGRENDTGVIESEVTIDLENLGVLMVRLHLQGEQLSLALRTDSLYCLQHLEDGREALATRLRNCGFRAPDIRIALLVVEIDRHG